MEQVVQLALGKHGQFGDPDLELIHLVRDIIPVEVTPVIDIPGFRVHDRVIASRVDLVDQYFFSILQFV